MINHANKNSNKESEEAILRGIKEEMAKPRIVSSARKPGMPHIFPLSGSQWTGSARPTRDPHRFVTHPGAL